MGGGEGAGGTKGRRLEGNLKGHFKEGLKGAEGGSKVGFKGLKSTLRRGLEGELEASPSTKGNGTIQQPPRLLRQMMCMASSDFAYPATSKLAQWRRNLVWCGVRPFCKKPQEEKGSG